ncbi:uncharacterized protein C8Q71DRAFT_854667 [Rhodofomes roseus]|uniref:Uncharacterized protein n=1 Tax=Rhodofomes roseus TaxID=34475 RepID=A0ABQ8KQA2_9APHY|nr:uncharacterized protein C8Q71DRAFT_854667 [Rhodofomes roseus]KAH9840802.1 hypothetical protein C8Q71DRAFT_854667 [Rhodofomes roseus]
MPALSKRKSLPGGSEDGGGGEQEVGQPAKKAKCGGKPDPKPVIHKPALLALFKHVEPMFQLTHKILGRRLKVTQNEIEVLQLQAKARSCTCGAPSAGTLPSEGPGLAAAGLPLRRKASFAAPVG